MRFQHVRKGNNVYPSLVETRGSPDHSRPPRMGLPGCRAGEQRAGRKQEDASRGVVSLWRLIERLQDE